MISQPSAEISKSAMVNPWSRSVRCRSARVRSSADTPPLRSHHHAPRCLNMSATCGAPRGGMLLAPLQGDSSSEATMRPQLPLIASALFLAGHAHADLVNGDFSSGGSGWVVAAPAGWTVTFPPNGGNPGGHARIESPGGSGGMGCIRQTFECGAPNPASVCSIPLDFRSDLGQVEGQARMRIFVNGQEFTVTALGPSSLEWRTNELGGYCGTDVLEICLDVFAATPPWALLLDNLESISYCDGVGIQPSLWSEVK